MATLPPIKIRYAPVRSYDVHQANYVGAQEATGKRGWWPNPPTPNANLDLSNNAIAVQGGHLVMVGGFTTVGGTSRAKLAVVQLATATLTSQTHTFTGGSAYVRQVETDGTYCYVGGDFTSVDGVSSLAGRSVKGLCRFDYDGVLDTTWNPSPNAAVDLIRYNPFNNTLYVHGDGITSFNGTARTRIGEVSLTDAGNLTSWTASPDDIVRCILVDVEGERVYLGGEFTQIDGAVQVRLARMTMTGTGAADAWAPAPDSGVFDMVLYGDLLYCVGAFTVIGSGATGRNGAATIWPDATAGPWNPNLGGGTGVTIDRYREVMLIGGSFTTVGGTGRNRLAAVTATGAGTLQAWNPNADGSVHSSILLDRTLYVAGAFANVNGAADANLAAIPYPIFTDTNTKYVAKTGSDAAAGTAAAPYLTITKALSVLTGAFTYAVVQDSGVYSEQLTVAYDANEAGGLFAAEGQEPTITLIRGAIPGTYGARIDGRVKFSTGAGATFYYVSKLGNDGTGARGNSSLPFLTITAALADGARVANDTIQIQDSGVYREDLDAAALAVTIQAADGQMPTLTAVTATGDHVKANAGIALRLYGLTLTDPVQATGHTVIVTGDLEVYDCTFNYNAQQIAATGAKTVAIVNCLFYGSHKEAIVSANEVATIAWTVTNCAFLNCATIGVGHGIRTIFIQKNGACSPVVTLTSCTFRDCSGDADVVYISDLTAVFKGYAIACLHEDGRDVVTLRSAYEQSIGSAVGSEMILTNCLARGLGGGFVAQIATAHFAICRGCVAQDCMKVGSTSPFATPCDFHGVNATNCASLNSGVAGFSPAGAAGTDVIVNCVAINPATFGFAGYNFGYRNCAEHGSGTFSVKFTSAASTLTYCCFGTAMEPTNLRGVGFVDGDPRFASDTAGEEDCALLADSPAINVSSTGNPIGLDNPLIDVTSLADPFSIDGISFESDPNFLNGIRAARALAADLSVDWCSFHGMGTQAVSLANRGAARQCLFADLSGSGVNALEAGVIAERCVGSACGGAAVLNAGVGASIIHVTAHGGGFGQRDFGSVSAAVQRDNVYAGASGLDYDGVGVQQTSDVVLLSAGASVEDGTRRDPLFRDVLAADLRLQAVAVGFPYDSPAIGIASDGGDAGAYDFHYGPLSLSWTELDFGTGAGDAALSWINPDHVPRQVVALKAVQVDTFGGDTDSFAAAYTLEHVLTWQADAKMPVAQREALLALFRHASSEVQVTFDGGATWTPCRLLKDKGPSYAELSGTFYSKDEVPRPLTELVLRESA